METKYKLRLPFKSVDNCLGNRIIGSDTATIAKVEPWAADQGVAEFIVTACNAHDQLVAENEQLKQQIEVMKAAAQDALKKEMEQAQVKEHLVSALQYARKGVFDTSHTYQVINAALAAAGA